MSEQHAVRRLRSERRLLEVLAAVLSIVVLLGCAERLSVSIGVWGAFVGWAVTGIVAVAWPTAFLVTGARTAPRQRRAVLLTALGVTLSSLGLLPIGWGLVMVLVPEYTVGWFFPSRTGGSEIGDVEDALYSGRLMIALGALFILILAALAAAIAHQESAPADPEGEDEESTSLSSALGMAAGLLLGACGVLFWIISLGIGLVAMIQYDGVRQRLAGCTSGTGACSTDIWVADELPWVLAAVSALALPGLVVAILVWNSLPWVARLPDVVRHVLVLVAAVVFHAGSVLAISSGALYARWSDATCTGHRTLRSCGARDPGFSFTQEWASWVTVWALVTYAVLAYVVVFAALASARSELAAREAEDRGRTGPAGAGSVGAAGAAGAAGADGASGRRVAVYLLSVVVLIGGGWTAISARHLASVPPGSAGSWEEYVAETMNASQHPHLEEVRFEIPTGHDVDSALIVQVGLVGDEPEMPAAEAADLIEAACAYVVSPWRSSTPETWVLLAYGPDGGNTRHARVDCGSAHRQEVGDLLTWLEQHPAGSAVAEISIRSRQDGVLETQLYLTDTSTRTVREGLDYLCSFPSTAGAPRSGALLDDVAVREVGDIDCSDPEAVLAQWRSHD